MSKRNPRQGEISQIFTALDGYKSLLELGEVLSVKEIIFMYKIKQKIWHLKQNPESAGDQGRALESFRNSQKPKS